MDVRSATGQVLAKTRGLWRTTVLEKAKFSLMFTDLTPTEVSDVQHHLESMLGYQSRANLRNYFGGVAIFALDTPRSYPALERVIQDFRAFDLRITDHQGKRITVDVHH
jgi:hypothetical protein